MPVPWDKLEAALAAALAAAEAPADGEGMPGPKVQPGAPAAGAHAAIPAAIRPPPAIAVLSGKASRRYPPMT